MNKLINQPDNIISEMLDGYLALNPSLYCKIPNVMGIKRSKDEDKVSVVIAGGGGNEPWVLGFVGDGLADGAALGNVYMAPPARSVLNVARAVPHSKGILFIATNHAGDVLNFELVRELAELEGITANCVYAADDITSAPLDRRDERRGTAGIFFAVKIAGAASKAGYSLEDTKRIVELAICNSKTIGVTTSTGYMPTGVPMCDLPDGYIEYGMGFNGEPGFLREALKPADAVVDRLMTELLYEIPSINSAGFAGSEVVFMINGYGFTSMLELCIVSRRVNQLVSAHGLTNVHTFIDTLFSPQGTGGFSVSAMILNDELKQLYSSKCYSPLFRFQGGL